jgi:3-methyladenine DNA glycosylase AlkD
MTSLSELKTELGKLADPEKKLKLQQFFKTGKGQYGEGDIFIGVSVPDLRKKAKKYRQLPLLQVEALLHSEIHEHRLVALHILVGKYSRGTDLERKKIVELYLDNTTWINNWDLVDSSAHKILGEYYWDKPKNTLYRFAGSDNLWERRISVISTFAFISRGSFEDSLNIAEILLHDEHDLIHKAVGWMLREIGKRDLAKEEEFLIKHYKTMPRTMLRYAIERFEKEKKQFYMKK